MNFYKIILCYSRNGRTKFISSILSTTTGVKLNKKVVLLDKTFSMHRLVTGHLQSLFTDLFTAVGLSKLKRPAVINFALKFNVSQLHTPE